MRVTIVAANAFRYDSRLRRTALALADDGHEIAIVAFADPGLPVTERIHERVVVHRVALDRRIESGLRPLPGWLIRVILRLLDIPPGTEVLPAHQASRRALRLATLRRGLEILANLRRVGPWTASVRSVAGTADVFHAKALIALPVIRSAARTRAARYAYDIADLHSEAARLARMPGPVRWVVRRRERQLLQGVAATFAVSEAVAIQAAAWFDIARPLVMRNTPPRWRPTEELPDDGPLLAQAAGVEAQTPIVLYQGGLSVDRGIEELVAALDVEPLSSARVTVVFLGYGRLEPWLRAEAQRRPGRLAVVDPVPPAELLSWTASATIAYIGFPPRTLNLRLALSNKLFEAQMAGVPVLVAEGTEHARVVAAHELGSVTPIDDPAALGTAIMAIVQESATARLERRTRNRRRALAVDNWEVEQERLVAAYRALDQSGVRSPAPVTADVPVS